MSGYFRTIQRAWGTHPSKTGRRRGRARGPQSGPREGPQANSPLGALLDTLLRRSVLSHKKPGK